MPRPIAIAKRRLKMRSVRDGLTKYCACAIGTAPAKALRPQTSVHSLAVERGPCNQVAPAACVLAWPCSFRQGIVREGPADVAADPPGADSICEPDEPLDFLLAQGAAVRNYLAPYSGRHDRSRAAVAPADGGAQDQRPGRDRRRAVRDARKHDRGGIQPNSRRFL